MTLLAIVAVTALALGVVALAACLCLSGKITDRLKKLESQTQPASTPKTTGKKRRADQAGQSVKPVKTYGSLAELRKREAETK